MKNDQFAVYRVDRNSEGRDLWHLSYQEAVSRKLAIRIEHYRQINLRPLLPGESAIALWKRMKESCEVSDVLVLNQNGEIHCYYVNEDYPHLLSGFIRLNPSGTLVTLDTENYRSKRQKTLEALAEKKASKAVRYGKKMSLEPMNPSERRIIHAKLQNSDKVFTFSEGDEPYRHVVVTLKKNGER